MKTLRSGMLPWMGAAALSVLLAGPVAAAEDYPSDRINFVVGFSAGGFADTMTRIFAQHLGERLGQTITVENQGGAGGNIAATHVAHAPADGYTVLATTTSIAVSQSLYDDLGYSLEDDLVAVALPVSSPETIAAHPDRPSGSLEEFLDWVRERGEVHFASAGVGSASHLVAEYFFKEMAGVNAIHVPYRGGSPANQAALAGEVDLVTSSNSVYPFIRDGMLNGLAIASDERHHAVPDVPTYAEQGYEGYEAASWVGFFVPAGTDPAIVEKLNAEINAILEDEAVREQLREAGVRFHTRSVEETQAFVRADVESYARMVEALGVTVE
jgi:tripartite-type tricarboxylate transporter receptor subunit TctC